MSYMERSLRWRRERAFYMAYYGTALERFHGRLRSMQIRDALAQGVKFYPGTTCMIGVRKLYVDVHGWLYPCERVETHDWMRIGHVDSGVDVDRAYGIVKEYSDTNKADCETCWALNCCSTFCIAQVSGTHGTCEELKREACQATKKMASKTLGWMTTLLHECPDALDTLFAPSPSNGPRSEDEP